MAQEPELHAVDHGTEKWPEFAGGFPGSMLVQRVQGAVCYYRQGEGILPASLSN